MLDCHDHPLFVLQISVTIQSTKLGNDQSRIIAGDDLERCQHIL